MYIVESKNRREVKGALSLSLFTIASFLFSTIISLSTMSISNVKAGRNQPKNAKRETWPQRQVIGSRLGSLVPGYRGPPVRGPSSSCEPVIEQIRNI